MTKMLIGDYAPYSRPKVKINKDGTILVIDSKDNKEYKLKIQRTVGLLLFLMSPGSPFSSQTQEAYEELLKIAIRDESDRNQEVTCD